MYNSGNYERGRFPSGNFRGQRIHGRNSRGRGRAETNENYNYYENFENYNPGRKSRGRGQYDNQEVKVFNGRYQMRCKICDSKLHLAHEFQHQNSQEEVYIAEDYNYPDSNYHEYDQGYEQGSYYEDKNGQVEDYELY